MLMKKTRSTNVFSLPAYHSALNWVSGVNFKRTGIKTEIKANKCLQKYFIFNDSSNSLQIQSSNYEDFFNIKGKALLVFSKQVMQWDFSFLQYALFLRENWLFNSLPRTKNLNPHHSGVNGSIQEYLNSYLPFSVLYGLICL